MSAIELTLIHDINDDVKTINATDFTGVSHLTIVLGHITAQYYADYSYLRHCHVFTAIADRLCALDRNTTPLRRIDFKCAFPDITPFIGLEDAQKKRARVVARAAFVRLLSAITYFPTVQEIYYDRNFTSYMKRPKSFGNISKLVVIVPPRDPRKLNEFFPCEMLQRSLITDIVKRTPNADVVPRDVISIVERIKRERPPFDFDLVRTYHPELKKILRSNEYAREVYPKAIRFVKALWKEKQGCFSILTKESFAKILSYLCIDDWKIGQEPTEQDRETIQEYLYQNKRRKK